MIDDLFVFMFVSTPARQFPVVHILSHMQLLLYPTAPFASLPATTRDVTQKAKKLSMGGRRKRRGRSFERDCIPILEATALQGHHQHGGGAGQPDVRFDGSRRPALGLCVSGS